MVRTQGRVDWAHLFFSSADRLGRAPFVASLGVVFLLFAAFDRWAFGPARSASGWLVCFLLFVCTCCLLAKSLHDRGRSGWWTAVIMFAFMTAWPRPDSAAGVVALLVLAVAAADLALGPGQADFNRFGPPPGVR